MTGTKPGPDEEYVAAPQISRLRGEVIAADQRTSPHNLDGMSLHAKNVAWGCRRNRVAQGADVKTIETGLGAIARVFAIGCVFHALTGCMTASNQTSTAASASAPAAPPAGYAAVHIGRPFGFNTSIFSLPVEVDGKPLISLAPNQYTTVNLRPGPHTIEVPNGVWTRAISGVPHPVEIVAEPGKSYYLLPNNVGTEDRGYTVTPIGNAVVVSRTSVNHSSFSVQTVAANAAPPAEFSQLSYAKAP